MVVMHDDPPPSVSAALTAHLRREIEAAGGWLPFDRYMASALYTPGLGYYASGSRQFGLMPASGSDFVTAPELSALFGQALAAQLAQALHVTGTDELWEFGAGSGALALQLLDALGDQVRRYTIVDLSGSLRQRQQERLARWGDRVRWVDALPQAMDGVIVGNEVLDAMPVQLLRWDGQRWWERGVVWHDDAGLAWEDRATALSPPTDELPGFEPGTLTEIHLQAEAFVRTLAAHLRRGAAFFIDYGFPQAEYYHPQRTRGTLACHRAHHAEFGDDDPLYEPGLKDITAHVNFTGIALAGQEAGLEVLGYTSQGRFLLNCGIAARMEAASLMQRAHAVRLVNEHEMGELFKVIGFVKGPVFDALGFSAGDRSHRL